MCSLPPLDSKTGVRTWVYRWRTSWTDPRGTGKEGEAGETYLVMPTFFLFTKPIQSIVEKRVVSRKQDFILALPCPTSNRWPLSNTSEFKSCDDYCIQIPNHFIFVFMCWLTSPGIHVFSPWKNEDFCLWYSYLPCCVSSVNFNLLLATFYIFFNNFKSLCLFPILSIYSLYNLTCIRQF